jgi:bacterioferritin-associated ferredoxin/uncharacterized Fe-S cluster-containing radical SAM superfamily protein
MAKFLTLTDKCNLRCAFCYEISPDGAEHTFEAEVSSFGPELYAAMHDEGWRDVVITGGEPTIMPTFFAAIAESKAQGYERIIVASNGRRFAYPDFTRRARETGLTHANISIFGHDRHIHDGTTKVRGSLEQTSAGIRNLVAAGIDVSCSIVVNRRNVEHLEPLMDHIWDLGARRLLVMGLKPFGGAFVERDKVFYDFAWGAPFVNAALQYGLAKGFDVTTMGLPSPPFDVSGTTDDNIRALKYFDYVLKRLEMDVPYCKGHLCDRCFGRQVCPHGADPGELLICKCKLVTESTIREAVRGGARTVRQVRDATNACTGCTTCAPDIKHLIHCEVQGIAYNPRDVALPGATRHGASDATGLTLAGGLASQPADTTEARP